MSSHPMPRGNPVIRALLAMLLIWPRVEVTPSSLVVTLGWAFRTTVLRASITDVAAVPWRRVSIGAHGFRGRWLVNTASGPLVRVTLARPAAARVLGVPVRLRELTLSIDDVDAFLTDLH
jgi:hypothetical protein